jgi:hypothetical protein
MKSSEKVGLTGFRQAASPVYERLVTDCLCLNCLLWKDLFAEFVLLLNFYLKENQQ